MAVDRIIEYYRGHLIVANHTGANIFLNKIKIHFVKGSSKEESFAIATAFIDSKYGLRESDRRAAHIGTVDDYYEALSVEPPADHEEAMLSAHRKAPDRKMTAKELATSAGWKSFSPANRHYGGLGKRIAIQLGLKINGDGEQYFTEVLAHFDEDTKQWEMHEELALALDRLNS